MTRPASRSTALPDDEFRAQVRDWLHTNLSGPDAPFADLVGVGGTGHEHEAIERRREWERTLGAAGWIGAGWPGEHGGRDLAVRTAGDLPRGVRPGRWSRAGSMHMSEQLLGPTLLAFGTPEQQARFLPGIVAGETLWCQGYSEPEAGSDLAGVRTRAVRDGDHYVLTGQKIWTSLAHLADWCFVLARTDPTQQRHRGLSYLLVPMDQPGMTVRPIVELTGTAEFNEVFFDGAVTAVEQPDRRRGRRLASGHGHPRLRARRRDPRPADRLRTRAGPSARAPPGQPVHRPIRACGPGWWTPGSGCR